MIVRSFWGAMGGVGIVGCAKHIREGMEGAGDEAVSDMFALMGKSAPNVGHGGADKQKKEPSGTGAVVRSFMNGARSAMHGYNMMMRRPCGPGVRQNMKGCSGGGYDPDEPEL